MCLWCIFVFNVFPSLVKPNAPCCLTVSHDFSRHNFTWKSTYEEYSRFTALTDNMKFQLHYYKRGGEQNVRFKFKYAFLSFFHSTRLSCQELFNCPKWASKRQILFCLTPPTDTPYFCPLYCFSIIKNYNKLFNFFF